MPFTIIELPRRAPQVIRLGRVPEPPVEPLIVKEIERPQIEPEMPEAIAEVQAVVGTPVDLEIPTAPKRPRGRPRKNKENENGRQ